MSEHFFIEENGYFAWPFASELPNGKWEAFAFFERKSDHASPFVPTVKHRIKAEFGSRDEAISAAGAFAIDLMQRNDTKLEGGDFVNNG